MFAHMSPGHFFFPVESYILEEMLAWSGILQEMSFLLLMSASLRQQPPTGPYPLELLTAITPWIPVCLGSESRGLQLARDPWCRMVEKWARETRHLSHIAGLLEIWGLYILLLKYLLSHLLLPGCA